MVRLESDAIERKSDAHEERVTQEIKNICIEHIAYNIMASALRSTAGA